MKVFTFLVGGKDYDTKKYEYFSYADKKIVDFKATFKIINRLKKGELAEDSPEASEYILAKYCVGDSHANKLAIDSAYKAYQKFKSFPFKRRRKIFYDMHKLLLRKKEEFIKLLIAEGHPRKLAEWEFEGMAVGSSPPTVDFYCRQIRKRLGKEKNEYLYWERRPDGVVCICPPSNASASNSYNAILVFLTGNSLIIKPPLRMPVSTIFLWKEVVNRALNNNGAPEGTLNIVLGNSSVIMNEWLESPKVNDIIFFGDSKKGLEVGKKVFLAEKKPILELSGNDLFLVWKDADLEKSSDALLDCFLGSTQICMVPKIALIHEGIYEEFVKNILGKVKRLKISLPTDPDTVFSPVAKIKDFFEFLKDSLNKGAKLIYGGKRVNYQGREDGNGLYLMPTLLGVEDNAKILEMRFLKEEIFFPLLPLIKISGTDKEIFQKMADIVSKHRYGLRLSLWISSPKYLRKFIKQLDNSGTLRINSRHIGFSYYLSTHGGVKNTGGPLGEMNYFWMRTSHLQGISVTSLEKK